MNKSPLLSIIPALTGLALTQPAEAADTCSPEVIVLETLGTVHGKTFAVVEGQRDKAMSFERAEEKAAQLKPQGWHLIDYTKDAADFGSLPGAKAFMGYHSEQGLELNGTKVYADGVVWTDTDCDEDKNPLGLDACNMNFYGRAKLAITLDEQGKPAPAGMVTDASAYLVVVKETDGK